ncbi:hypothetical protein PIB30_040189 [Stylosanthes scabra]|uniref:Armadillo repeat-containing protein 8 n=1 Tax=Stylosanthes scabra TaxID=79078 RepID=A0ABU6ZD77_9FABA|nr:hypothetical protein [Stylosanthes scabra]
MPTASTSSSDHILDRLASSDGEVKLKAVREVKNQIIGNRTKKLSYIKLGAVPAVTAAIADADSDDVLIVQSAAALGSFACGVDAGVRAVLDAGAFPHLIRLLSASDEKVNSDDRNVATVKTCLSWLRTNVTLRDGRLVVDAAARSLRMIYQSKLAPKYEFLKEDNIDFLRSLLKSENENLTVLGAGIVIHSCETSDEQNNLCCAGFLEMLTSLLDGSLSQRDTSLESLAAIIRNNPEVVSKFVDLHTGRALSSVIELTKDRFPRTRLLACLCLICVKNSSSCYLQDMGTKTKLVYILLELLDDCGQVGDEASFAFSSLIADKEDMHKLAFEANAIDKFCSILQKHPLHPRRLEGVFLALGNLCSKLECCRSRFISLQVLDLVVDALTHDDTSVRAAACVCLRSVSRSIKTLSAGHFLTDKAVITLVQLLSDHSNNVQVAALGVISNIAIDFSLHKSVFMQYGGIKELVQLTKSMDSSLRLNAIWALRNMVFHTDKICKEVIFVELTASAIASLICDPEPSVQEQTMGLVRNFVHGCIYSVEYAFAEDGIILDAIGRQLQKSSKVEIGIQGMYVLVNIASGNEFHKESVMQLLFPQAENESHSFFNQFLQSNNWHLRSASIWVIVNLTVPESPDAFSRIMTLRRFGIVSQIQSMVNDSHMDVKLRARHALGQISTFGDG